MPLPNDTPITQLAKVFQVSTAALTPAARKLTKGDLVSLLGAQDDVTAMQLYAQYGQPPEKESERAARGTGLDLTVEDITSIHRVFGSPVVPIGRLALADQGFQQSMKMRMPDGISIYACCCPCCCATAVIRPARTAVA